MSCATAVRSADDELTNDPRERGVAGVNLKMYFGLEETYQWLGSVARLCSDLARRPVPRLDIFVMPSFPTLGRAAEILAGTGISVGAQDAAPVRYGARTGEVSAAMVADLGCRYLLVGHAERRAQFHEDDEVVAQKIDQALTHELVPVLCVGERDHLPVDAAVEVCRRQMRAIPGIAGGRQVIVAYEPVWAIGAPEPAPAAHVRRVCAALRDPQFIPPADVRVLYGGAAGLGTFHALHPAVDGLFLGRFAHRPERFRAIAAEIAGRHLGGGLSWPSGKGLCT